MSPPEPAPRPVWQVLALLAAVVFVLYGRTAFFGYVYLDDNALILDQREFLSRGASLIDAFRTDVFRATHGLGAYYRPLMTVSLILDALWGGVDPLVFHLTNILVHAGAVCLLFLLLGRLGLGPGPALFGALAFAVHPALTQAVALIVGRNDSLLGLFAFASLLLLLDFSRQGGWLRGLGHLAFFALALFTKETGLMIPAAGLAYLQGVRRERLFTGRKACLLAGWLLVAGLWFFLRRAALHNPLPMSLAGLAGGLPADFLTLLRYFGKALLPFNLSVLPCVQDSTVAYGAAAVVGLAAALFCSKGKDGRLALFGLFWFCLFLLPSLALGATTVSDLLNEQRLYLPLVGALIAALETDWLKAPAGPSPLRLLPRALVLAGLALAAFHHSGHYRDRMSFWTNAVETSPHLPLAHRNLGAMLYLDNRRELAAAQFQAALALNPSEPMAHGNLGLVYLDQGRYSEAETELRQELDLNPGYDNAYFNMGLLCYRSGRLVEAEAFWGKTLEVNPGYVDAAVNQALLYLQTDPVKAALYLEELRKANQPAYLKVSQIAHRKP